MTGHTEEEQHDLDQLDEWAERRLAWRREVQ